MSKNSWRVNLLGGVIFQFCWQQIIYLGLFIICNFCEQVIDTINYILSKSGSKLGGAQSPHSYFSIH